MVHGGDLDQDHDRNAGDHLGITGKALGPPGRLLFYNGDKEKTAVAGSTELKHRHWHHILLVREGDTVRVHLDGGREPEIEAAVSDTRPEKKTQVFVGGRADGLFAFEGKIDEVAVFGRALREGAPLAFGRLHPGLRTSAR